MSRLPFPNFTNQPYASQNHLVQMPPPRPEFAYQQGMLPPQSEYYMSLPQQPPPAMAPPPLPPMMFPPPPPPPVPAPMYPSVGTAQTLASGYQNKVSNQEQQQYCVTKTDECDKLCDQMWTNKWLNEIMSRKKKEIKTNSTNSSIKLHEMKDKISNVLHCIRELENSARVMGLMVKSVDEVEWNRKCEEVEKKKSELLTRLRDLESSPELMMCMQEKLKKRKKKREYLKRRAERRKKMKEEAAERRKMLHKQIDLWLNEMEESVDRTRREEELKQQADAVLSSVMQKKAEARKQIALLSALLQLRQARVTAILGTGRTVSQTQINTFNEVIEKLKAMWTKQLDEYLLEEQGLRLMLSESIKVDNKHSTDAREKQIYRQWEEAIFGADSTNNGEPLNQEEFIERRRAWDQFVVNERTVMASSIPPGWVIPVPPSDDVWRQQLKSSK